MTFGELRGGPGARWLAAMTDFDDEEEVRHLISEFEGQPTRLFYVVIAGMGELVMIEPLTAHEAIAWRRAQRVSA